MHKIALGIEYNGAEYFGFQRQPNVPTVQNLLEKALSKVANESIQVCCAGRTDRGVHALEQVVHFDTNAIREEIAWIFGANTHLPESIKVLWAKPVQNDFDARRSALYRRYLYVIQNHRVPSGVFSQNLTWVGKQLDESRMQEAANYLIGEHDFSAFRAAGCQSKTPVKTIKNINITRIKQFVVIDIKANAFLHNMVRNIVGSLIPIGHHLHMPCHLKAILESRQRVKAGLCASPKGLYFVKAGYPAHFGLDGVEQDRASDFITGLVN